MNDQNLLSIQIVLASSEFVLAISVQPWTLFWQWASKNVVIEKLLSSGCHWVMVKDALPELYITGHNHTIEVCMWLYLLLLPVNAFCVHLWAGCTIQYLEPPWHLFVGKEVGQLLHQLSMLKMQLDPSWSVFRWMSCMWIGNSSLKMMVHSTNDLKGKYAAAMTWKSCAL